MARLGATGMAQNTPRMELIFMLTKIVVWYIFEKNYKT